MEFTGVHIFGVFAPAPIDSSPLSTHSSPPAKDPSLHPVTETLTDKQIHIYQYNAYSWYSFISTYFILSEINTFWVKTNLSMPRIIISSIIHLTRISFQWHRLSLIVILMRWQEPAIDESITIAQNSQIVGRYISFNVFNIWLIAIHTNAFYGPELRTNGNPAVNTYDLTLGIRARAVRHVIRIQANSRLG